MEHSKNKLRVYLITGMSGAGKSSALKILEDMNYEAMDNVPISLIENAASLVYKNSETKALAIGIDFRTIQFDYLQIQATLEHLKSNENYEVKLIYFDCENAILARRFTETRRSHPLAKGDTVANAINNERIELEGVRGLANYIFDTTELASFELRQIIMERFEFQSGTGLNVSVMSFGYPKGLPRNADIVFDVRFLRNPHYDDSLRLMTGQSEEVRHYVYQDEKYEEFWSGLKNMILMLLPQYVKEGKSYLTIAFGCTGGRHRSVTLAENMAKLLKENKYSVNLMHRELGV